MTARVWVFRVGRSLVHEWYRVLMLVFPSFSDLRRNGTWVGNKGNPLYTHNGGTYIRCSMSVNTRFGRLRGELLAFSFLGQKRTRARTGREKRSSGGCGACHCAG